MIASAYYVLRFSLYELGKHKPISLSPLQIVDDDRQALSSDLADEVMIELSPVAAVDK